MRLFIAIELSEDMKAAITSFQQDLKKRGVTGNYTKPENLHLTVAFIGEYGDPYDVLDALHAVSFKGFDIKLSEPGNFGELIYLGLDAPEDLNRLVKSVRHCLADNGIPFDRKRFRPHITLVRKADMRKFREREDITVTGTEMTVTKVSLMRSDRGKSGMIYTEMGSIAALNITD